MFDTLNLSLFILSGILLNLVPGPDTLYIIAQSSARGLKAGIVAALSIASGTFVHIFAAAFGLSALLATSAMAFTVVKILGCCYLLYMGCSMLFSKQKPAQKQEIKKDQSLLQIFSQGFLTNALNPKVALFFLSFVPQFISSTAQSKELTFLFLGLIFNINSLLWGFVLVISSIYIGKKVKQYNIVPLLLKRFAGAVFIYFGVKLALSKPTA